MQDFGTMMIKRRASLLLALAALIAIPRADRAQEAGYPVTLIPPAKGPFTFPAGYQTPWDKIEIMVDGEDVAEPVRAARLAGARPAHPDASGGRAMALFGPDGVLMVDTQNRQVAEKTLKALRIVHRRRRSGSS